MNLSTPTVCTTCRWSNSRNTNSKNANYVRRACLCTLPSHAPSSWYCISRGVYSAIWVNYLCWGDCIKVGVGLSYEYNLKGEIMFIHYV